MNLIDYNLTGAVFDIQRPSLYDGSGTRTIVFLKGCPLPYKWCSNPESQSIKPVIMYKVADHLHYGRCMTACKKGVINLEHKNWVNRGLYSGCGECANACPASALAFRGKTMSTQQVIRGLKKDATTCRRSDGDIILSGGELLVQYELASELLQACKGQGWHTAIETIGVESREAIEKVIPYMDAVLLDLKHMDNGEHRKFIGIGSEPVIKNAPEVCKMSKTAIRVPVIPGFNYSVEIIKAISRFVGTLADIWTIHLLSHHFFGENKYGLLGQDCTIKQVKPLVSKDLEEYRTMVESYGFQYIIDGQTRFQNGGRRTDQQLIEKVVKQAPDESDIEQEECRVEATKEEYCDNNIGLTEFIGTAIGDTIGLVTTSVDPLLVDVVRLGKHRSIGTVGGRVGAGPQIRAINEVVKATNTEIISVELPRNTEGGVGHGSLIYIGTDGASDTRGAVEITFQVLPKYFGDAYGNDAGHLEFQYTARASYCLEKVLGAPVGGALGVTCAGSAAIGTVLMDIAVKAANAEVVGYRSPSNDTSYSNGAVLTFTGNSGAVCQVVKASTEAEKKMLGALGDEPKSTATPYIQ